MRHITTLMAAAWIPVVCGIALASEAMPQAVITRIAGESGGPSASPIRLFTDRNGMTLYVADSDRVPNVSNCYDNCGHNWPAFNALETDRDTGDWKVILRDDGTRQWAYKGKPVYRFILDRAPGDIKGNGIGNIWHTFGP